MQFRKEHGLIRAEYLRRFSHKSYAAKNDYIGVGILCAPAEFQRVPGKIGNILNLGPLIKMREDNCVS